MDSAGDRERSLDAPGQGRDPRSRRERSEESEGGNVRTTSSSTTSMSARWKRVKSVSPSAPAASSWLREVGERGEERRELDRDGDAQPPLHLAHDLDHPPLDLGPARRGVAGRVVEVQLQGVGAGLLHQAGVGGPAPGRGAVERGEDRHADRLLHAPQVLQVFVGPERLLGLGSVARGLGEGVVVALGVEERVHLLARDLFLVQRAAARRRRPPRPRAGAPCRGRR